MVLEAGRSKIKVSVDLMSGENPLRDLHTATFLQDLHAVETKMSLIFSSSYEGTNPIIGALPHDHL